MATRALQYRFKDGDSLNESALNSRFLDIDLRVGTLEGVSMSWQRAVTELQNHGIERLNEAVLPLVEQVREDAEKVIRLIEEAGDVATQAELDAAMAQPTSAQYERDAGGRLAGITEVVNGMFRRTIFTRSNGRLVSVATDYNGRRRTVNYTYSAEGALTGFNAQEKDIDP